MRFLLLILGLLILGCQKQTATDCNLTANYCSCDRRSSADNPDCRDYEAMSQDSAKSSCSTAGGAFSSTGLCTTSQRVGTCKFTSGSQVTYQRYYLDSVATAAAGAAVCAYYKANCFVISGNALCDGVWTSDT